eukprot:m.92546 g.92546  ORF g.92546 m.92546 type:complete len:317 (+) comp26553_c0_seq1:115-1065(+)
MDGLQPMQQQLQQAQDILTTLADTELHKQDQREILGIGALAILTLALLVVGITNQNMVIVEAMGLGLVRAGIFTVEPAATDLICANASDGTSSFGCSRIYANACCEFNGTCKNNSTLPQGCKIDVTHIPVCKTISVSKGFITDDGVCVAVIFTRVALILAAVFCVACVLLSVRSISMLTTNNDDDPMNLRTRSLYKKGVYILIGLATIMTFVGYVAWQAFVDGPLKENIRAEYFQGWKQPTRSYLVANNINNTRLYGKIWADVGDSYTCIMWAWIAPLATVLIGFIHKTPSLDAEQILGHTPQLIIKFVAHGKHVT